MLFIKQQKKYKPNLYNLKYFINTFWFIPSDVLQRGMEASIWNMCSFKKPILDIGIGNGKLTNFLFRGHPQIDVGIDIEKEGLELAKELEMSKGKKRYKKVLWENAEKMSFKDSTFNTVISNSTFEHIEKDMKAVAEVGRVLKKGGLFFLTVPSEYLQEWILEYESLKDKTKAEDSLNTFNKRTVHLHYRPLDIWEKNFEKNGMKLIFHRYYFRKNVAIYWYKLFKIFTFQINKRELWSYTGHSKLTKVLPKKTIINLLEKKILKDAFQNGFFTDNENGAQLFMIAKKV